jgi:alpha-beta hydrolase superfamily lysophospholipase
MRRRDAIKGVVAGMSAAALGPRAVGTATAQAPGAGVVVSSEHWARKGDVSLYLFRKRLAPRVGEPPRPVLILVHGSSNSSRSSFDLTVPGAGRYSVMDTFAEWGYDVWTLDHEGYGRSTWTDGNSDVASGVADLQAATDVVARETGRTRFHFYGGSSGALRAGAFAMARPERVDRLICGALTYTGKGSPTLGKRAESLAYFRAHHRRPRDRAMIRSIFTRDKPGTSDPRVAEALADAELVFGDTIPTGTYLDMTANLPVVDPARIAAPVLVLRGEHDGIATEADLVDFFTRLASRDKQLIVLPGTAHSLLLGLTRQQVWHVMRAFLELPSATA